MVIDVEAMPAPLTCNLPLRSTRSKAKMEVEDLKVSSEPETTNETIHHPNHLAVDDFPYILVKLLPNCFLMLHLCYLVQCKLFFSFFLFVSFVFLKSLKSTRSKAKMEVEDLKVSSEPETTNETTGEPIYPGKRKRSTKSKSDNTKDNSEKDDTMDTGNESQ
jgi:hypothetical protein